MQKRNIIGGLAIVGLLLVGCTTTNQRTQTAATTNDDDYVTGSRIPRKDKNAVGTKVLSASELDQLKTSGAGSGAAPSGK